VERALRVLDDTQAEVKGQVEDLLAAYEKDRDVEALVTGLKGELSIPHPTEEVFNPLKGFATLGLSSVWGSCNFCTERTEKVWGVRSNVPGCTVVVRFCPACFKQVGFWENVSRETNGGLSRLGACPVVMDRGGTRTEFLIEGFCCLVPT
jgi:hypothetical protein